MGRIVNQRELSEILGISQKSLSLWVRDGLPVQLETEAGLANQYDTEAVINWYVAREVSKHSKETEKDRLSRLQGDKIELELATMRSMLIPADQIEPAWTGMVVAFRQTLRSLSTRLSHLLVGKDNPDAIRVMLDEEIDLALNKLAIHDESSADRSDAEGTRALRGPAEHQAVSMG
jgi:terminase small subunit / prophage DNA-packing protein